MLLNSSVKKTVEEHTFQSQRREMQKGFKLCAVACTYDPHRRSVSIRVKSQEKEHQSNMFSEKRKQRYEKIDHKRELGKDFRNTRGRREEVRDPFVKVEPEKACE